MPTIRITGTCSAPPSDGVILFPARAGSPSAGRVVVTVGGRRRVLNAGIRTDHGTGACVSGSLLHAAGGEGSEIEWRPGRWYDLYRYDKAKLKTALVAVLALIASLALAVVAFMANSSSAHAAARTIAVAILALTILNSVLTFADGPALEGIWSRSRMVRPARRGLSCQV
jgi:hypothetical protein